MLTGALGVLSLALMQFSADHPGLKDPELFTRMPNYVLPWASTFEERAFETVKFPVRKGAVVARETVEGRFRKYAYYFNRIGVQPGTLQIMRYYQAAAARLGGEVVFESAEATTIRLSKPGGDTWVLVEPFKSGVNYSLTIVERQAKQQTANAETIASGLKETGHADVPGIVFVSEESELKPESEPALKEILKVLRAAPKLRVWVVCHTDTVGSEEFTLSLSNDRAAAVVRALTEKFGVDANRLAPFGAGPYAPVAANTTEEGRTRNRRVELVVRP